MKQAIIIAGKLDGDGYGSGDGSGDGYGDGYGSIEDLVFCVPLSVNVTAKMLREHKACADYLQLFERTFPSGAQWPRDRDQAIAAGLDLNWARQKLGLLPVLSD